MGSEGDSNSNSNDSARGGEGEGVAINIRCANGSKFTVRTSLESTVEAFKAVLAQNCDVPAAQQRLIYKGRILKDDQTLQSYGLLLLFINLLFLSFSMVDMIYLFNAIFMLNMIGKNMNCTHCHFSDLTVLTLLLVFSNGRIKFIDIDCWYYFILELLEMWRFIVDLKHEI